MSWVRRFLDEPPQWLRKHWQWVHRLVAALAGAGVALVIHFAENPDKPWQPFVLLSALAWILGGYLVVDYVVANWGYVAIAAKACVPNSMDCSTT